VKDDQDQSESYFLVDVLGKIKISKDIKETKEPV
jgi:hypothetical protein